MEHGWDRGNDGVWLFGYGSLIWRVDFPYRVRLRAAVRDFSRRFWQGSHDHRGTLTAPGRVVTLTPEPGALCVGMAYRIDAATFAPLDHREKNGYVRVRLPIEVEANDGVTAVVDGVTYIAEASNEAFLGPANLEHMARHILASSGPSGSNVEYVLELAQALSALNADDPHVFTLERRLRQLMPP
ncbi:MAG: gamma-glutamylcyclotransferase [Gammaproteobacteria bacterium]|nr:gamma-glutamylcyclotransferase [Gammaproteobacteria bacterium]